MYRRKIKLTPSEHGPPLSLLTTLNTLLILSFRERTKSLLIMRDTERFSTRRRGFSILSNTFSLPKESISALKLPYLIKQEDMKTYFPLLLSLISSSHFSLSHQGIIKAFLASSVSTTSSHLVTIFKRSLKVLVARSSIAA